MVFKFNTLINRLNFGVFGQSRDFPNTQLLVSLVLLIACCLVRFKARVNDFFYDIQRWYL